MAVKEEKPCDHSGETLGTSGARRLLAGALMRATDPGVKQLLSDALLLAVSPKKSASKKKESKRKK